MADEGAAGDGQQFTPYTEGRNVPLMVEEAIKILKNVKETDFVHGLPEKPRSGDIFIFKASSDQNLEDWKNDGLKWKSSGVVHLPRQKKPLVCRRTLSVVNADGGVNNSMRKDVYCWEVGEGDKTIFLVHYIGKPGESDAAEESEAIPTDANEADKGKSESAESDKNKLPTEGEEAAPDVAVEGPSTPTAESAEDATTSKELAEAMKKVQAALGTQTKSPKVMDMFNKLMETMVSNKDNPDLELCLVVADKKSGKSSLIGTDEAKKIATTPRRGLRKRKRSVDEEESELNTEDDDVDDKSDEDSEKQPAKIVLARNKARTLRNRKPEENTVIMANGKTEVIPIPKNEVFFSPTLVSNEEKRIHSDFFDNSYPKRTKERYLILRNHIISRWSQLKPHYMGTNQAMKGLQRFGDVGVFRRVHRYLECKGVINYGSKDDSELEDNDKDDDEESQEVSDDETTSAPKAKIVKLTPKTGSVGRGRPRGRPRKDKTQKETPAKVVKEKKVEEKNKPNNEEVLLSPSGRRRRNVATHNWADIFTGKATFYKDDGLFHTPDVKENIVDDEEGESGRKRGRPRKIKEEPISADEAGEESDTDDKIEESEIPVATPRGRGRPRKDGSVSKPKSKYDYDEEFRPTPRARGRPRKESMLQNIIKNTPAGAPPKKRGRPRKYPVSTDVDEEIDDEDYELMEEDEEEELFEEEEEGELMEEEEEEPSTPFKHGDKRRQIIQYLCKTCKKGFASPSLLKEHMETHMVTVKTEAGNETAANIDDGDDDDDFTDMLDDDRDGDYQPEEENNKHAQTSDDENENISTPSFKKKYDKFPTMSTKKVYNQALRENRPVCKVCGTVFLTHANLRKHNLLHSNKMYECPFCAKLMKRKDYVVAHVRKVHKDVDLEENPIDFSKLTHYVYDDNNEDGRKPVEEEDEIEEEIVLDELGVPKPSSARKPQTGLAKSVCPECMNVFDTNEELEQHMIVVHRKELQDSSYKCHACMKEFKTLVSYQVHKLTHRKKEHECPHCKAVFNTNSQLQVHKRHDHNIQYGTLMYFGYLMNNDRITCEICSADFDSMSEYHDHRPEHLSMEFLCRECGNGFDTEEELSKHTESKCTYQNLHLPCGVCNTKFAMYDTRRKHISTAHKKTSDYYCHHCGAVFLNMEALRTHFQVHKSERIFECEFCEKKFFEKRTLVDHRELHRYNKSYQCNICERYYISSKSLQRHVKLHLNKDSRCCQTCNIEYNTNEELIRHMAEVHSTIKDEEKDREGLEHKCNICGRKFLFKARLVKHMQLHDANEEPETYDCPHCYETYDTVTMPMWKHLKYRHPEEVKKNRKDYMCNVCGFTTKYRQRLERHKETHFPDRKFQCRFCDKRFQTTSSMLTHMIIHRGKIKKGIKKHSECSWPDCPKMFMKHSNLKRHLMSHIFKVKVGKDWCECKNCEAKNPVRVETLTLDKGSQPMDEFGTETEYQYFQEEDGTAVLVRVSSNKGAADGSQPSEPVKFIVNNTGVEGYESMDVLQEAIAQIEDIEKNAGNATVRSGELTQVTQTDGTQTTTQTTEETHLADSVSTVTVETESSNLVIPEENQEPAVVGDIEEDGTAIIQQTDGTQHIDGIEVTPNAIPETVTQIVQESLQDAQTATVSDSVEDTELADPGLDNHTVTECVYECGVCDLMFETKCQVLAHLEGEHLDNRFPQCQVCKKFYIDKKNLTEHSTIHLGSRDYSCDVCSKSFRTKQCLRQHQHIHAEVKPFTCTYCGHGFTQRGFFEEHVRRHTGDRPFKCIVCGKGFVSKNLLKIHMYSHTGNKPHKCPHCPKSFSENYQLTNHIRTHTDDRPFQCSECDKAFFVKPKLIRHMNTVHSIDKDLLTSFVPTKIGSGVGYRDRDKMKNPRGDRKTQVVYIDAQGNIISQQIKSEREIQLEKEKIKSNKTITQKVVRPQTSATTAVVSQTGPQRAFEVVTRRDHSGQIQVNTLLDNPEHVVIENEGQEPQQLVMNTDGTVSTVMSIPENAEDIVYTELETDGATSSIELNGQNYTLVTQAEGSNQEGHLQLITQALAGVQAQNDLDQGQIQVITEEISGEEMQTDDGAIQIYAQAAADGITQEGAENISINIGEDGTVDAADFEKIEALRNMYNDQPIVIVLESQQQ